MMMKKKKNGLSALLSRLGIRKGPYIYGRPIHIPLDLPEPPLRSLPSSRPASPSLEADGQQQSLLISRIPVEIRLIIWEYALSLADPPVVLHLDVRDGTLRYCPCFERDPEKLCFRHICWSSRIWYQRKGEADEHFNPAELWGARLLLGPLLTCKLIYREAVDALYSCNTFDFRRSASVIRLPHVILPHRLQRIRSIKIGTAFSSPVRIDLSQRPGPPLSSYRYQTPDSTTDWLEACRILASLEHLTDLEVTIAIWPPDLRQGSPVRDEEVLALVRPLTEARAVHFLVVLTTSITVGISNEFKDAPFEIVQRERPGIGFSLPAWDS